MPNLVVFAYDDSPDARLALERAATMLPGWHAIIVHAWSSSTPPMSAALGTPMPPDTGVLDDSRDEQAAHHIVAEGTAQARRAGLDPESVVQHVDGTMDIAAAILTVAEDREAQLVVAGRRGVGRLRAALLGSVSDGLIRDATIPVLIVPGQSGGVKEA